MRCQRQRLPEAPVEARVVVLHKHPQLRHPGQVQHLLPLQAEGEAEALRLLRPEASNKKRTLRPTEYLLNTRRDFQSRRV
jgi:hypothetical protein